MRAKRIYDMPASSYYTWVGSVGKNTLPAYGTEFLWKPNQESGDANLAAYKPASTLFAQKLPVF